MENGNLATVPPWLVSSFLTAIKHSTKMLLCELWWSESVGKHYLFNLMFITRSFVLLLKQCIQLPESVIDKAVLNTLNWSYTRLDSETFKTAMYDEKQESIMVDCWRWRNNASSCLQSAHREVMLALLLRFLIQPCSNYMGRGGSSIHLYD